MSIQTRADRLAALVTLRGRVDEEIERLVRELGAQYADRRRSRFDVPPCGTETAYQRHRARGEQADDVCKFAHRIHERERTAS